MFTRNCKRFFLILAFIFFAFEGSAFNSATAEVDTLQLDPSLEDNIRDELAIDASTPISEEEISILTSLFADEGNIQSIVGLEHAVFLTELSLSFNQIRDISVLSDLPSLETVFLDHNAITDISALSGLPSLKTVFLNHNAITDISALSGLPSLETVFLNHNAITDISPLLSLPNLKLVSLNDNQLDESAEEVLEALQAKGVDFLNIVEQKPTTPSTIEVRIDEDPLSFPEDPVLIEGTTMVPFRTLFETFGLEVDWVQETKSVIGEKERLRIELTIDDPTAYVNNKAYTLPVAPTLINGHTMVPLRFIGEVTGRHVKWDSETRSVDINSTITSYNLDILYANETVYEGETVDDTPNGFGKFLYNGTLFYEGEVKDGLIEGYGKMYDVNNPNSYYEGQFVNNRFHGEGKTVYSDGSYHEGLYEDGLFNGLGTLYEADGTLQYSGMFQDNEMHGRGTGYYGDFKYVGMYQHGVKHGNGKLYYENELYYDGLWDNDSQVRGKVYVDGILFYEGDILNGNPYGYGAYFSEDGHVTYRGQLRNFSKTGVGIIYYQDGYTYIGEVYHGMEDGQGVLKGPDASIIHEGYFSDGEIVLDPDELADDPNTKIKQLLRYADHVVIDGMYENSLGLNSLQAAMIIELDNVEHIEIFNELTDENKIKLVDSYTQEHWGEVIGVNECFTYITYDSQVYAQATIRYSDDGNDIEITLYPDGAPMLEMMK